MALHRLQQRPLILRMPGPDCALLTLEHT